MFAVISILLAAVATVDAARIQSGEEVGKVVSAEGSVLSVVRDEIDSGFNWIVLGTDGGKIYAAVADRQHPLAELQKLTDAEIRITGMVGRFTSWRSFLGYLLCFNDNPACGYTVIKPASADPFAVPNLGPGPALHRRKVCGKVIAVTRNRIFFRTLVNSTNATTNAATLCAIPAEGCAIPEVGAVITISGFPRYGKSTPILDNAHWRLEQGSSDRPESAESVDSARLFVKEAGRHYADNQFCGRIIELTGTVDSVSKGDRTASNTLILDCDGTDIRVDLGGLAEGIGNLPEIGARISVAGLCYGDFADDGNVFPRLGGFTLIPRTPEDIRLIAAAPWLTPRVLLIAIGILSAALALFAVWIAALRALSIRRARELAREQILGAKAELKVEERTRLAVELHDSISQTLTGVALQIDAANSAEGEGAKRFLTTARNLLASCRQELNGCLWDLRSRTFEEKDMTEAVQRTLAPHVGSAKLTVRFNVPRELLSEATAHAVLRIIRELGTNAVRHGHAKNIRIAGEFHDGTISFSVADDGLGFNPASSPGPAQGHFGLQGIRERLNGFNGTIHCESEPGCGAKFTVAMQTTNSDTE